MVQESAGCGCLNGVVVLLVLAELVGLMHGFSDWGCLVGIVGGTENTDTTVARTFSRRDMVWMTWHCCLFT